MAAPERDKDIQLCEKCFLLLPDDAEFCPECGAPVDKDPVHLQGSDAAVYPELARANLLRMRGDFRQAEEVCIRILRQYPNQATANALLGDICAEKGDLEQAAEWYELALELVPNSVAETQKLERVKSRIKERELASTAANLGIPTKRTPVGLIAGLIAFAIVATAIAAFFLGRSNPAPEVKKQGGDVLNLPVTVGTPETNTPENQSEPENKTPDEPSAPPAAATIGELGAAIASKLADGSRITDCWMDKRTKRIFISFRVSDSDKEKLVTLALARAAFDHVPDCPKITVRGFRGGTEIYEADVLRTDFEATTKPEWIEQNGSEPEKAADVSVTNEWRPTATETSPPPVEDR